MITRYVVRGMPSDHQGRVPWPGAREWVANNIHPSMSGNWVHRQATKLGSPKKINLADPYTRGVVDGFRRARHNIRENLPEVLGAAVGLNAGERTFYLAILDHLMDQWLDAGPDDKLPPIDWSTFREEAPELEKYFIEIQESLAAGKDI
jgi:hypothetical protein